MSSETALERVAGGGVEVTLPPGWERLTDPDLAVVVAAPARQAAVDGAMFRSSLNAVVAPVVAGTDIRSLGTEAIAAAHVVADEVHVLAYDVWAPYGADRGRRLEFTYRAGPFDLGVIQWIALGDGVVTTLTATYSIDRASHRPLFEALVDSAALPGLPSQVALQPTSAVLPRLDPYLVAIGEPLEDLTRVSSAQPFRSGGPMLPRDDLALLVRAAGRRLRKVTPSAALVQAELMDVSGAVTEQGRAVVQLLTKPAARLRVESGRGHTPLTVEAYMRGGVALLVATASPAPLNEEPAPSDLVRLAATVGLDLVDATSVPRLLASWVGLGPAWRLATSPDRLDRDVVLARVDDPHTAPPPEADAHLRHTWGQPWFLWTVQSSAIPARRAWINTGGTGHFLLTDAGDGRATFESAFSQDVWADLLRLVTGSVRG